MGPTAGDSAASEFRDRVYAAAHDELAHWGIDRFNLVALAHRHRLDIDEIREHWADEIALIVDVLLDGSRRRMVLPDTGSLRGDLLALAIAMAHYVTSPDGHQLQGTHLIGDTNQRSLDIRRELWNRRSQRLAVIIDRARERGELRDGIETETALELLFAPINMRALFTAQPIDDAYCQNLADCVWRAIAADG